VKEVNMMTKLNEKKWLSDILGKDSATVSKWVANTTQPSLEALIVIANAFEVPVQELVRQGILHQDKIK
jgi:transcriptional regulator with XRE-family HTH domain